MVHRRRGSRAYVGRLAALLPDVRAARAVAYSEAGFRSGYLGVSQLQVAREPAWS